MVDLKKTPLADLDDESLAPYNDLWCRLLTRTPMTIWRLRKQGVIPEPYCHINGRPYEKVGRAREVLRNLQNELQPASATQHSETEAA